MKRALAALAWVMVILIAAIFGCQALFSSVPGKASVIQTVEEGRIVGKAGMDYLLDLRQQGRLPGMKTNEHGNACISGELTYHPWSLTMCFNKKGEASTNHYSIVQMKKGSPWQLKRAWQTDSNGQILQEWPVN